MLEPSQPLNQPSAAQFGAEWESEVVKTVKKQFEAELRPEIQRKRPYYKRQLSHVPEIRSFNKGNRTYLSDDVDQYYSSFSA